MSDADIVRDGLHYYGDEIPNDPETLATALAALARMEEERDACKAFASQLIQEKGVILDQYKAEVERLRDGPMAKVNAELRAEVERYRAVHDGRFEDIVRTLTKAEAEVERLRTALKEIAEGRVLGMECPHYARQALEAIPEPSHPTPT